MYSLTSTYVSEANRLVVCWRRLKTDTRRHEVRYAFQSVHKVGWDAAGPVPKGVITPPGAGGYDCMVYDTIELPLAGQRNVYIAMRPEGATQFSEIAVPLRAQ